MSFNYVDSDSDEDHSPSSSKSIAPASNNVSHGVSFPKEDDDNNKVKKRNRKVLVSDDDEEDKQRNIEDELFDYVEDEATAKKRQKLIKKIDPLLDSYEDENGDEDVDSEEERKMEAKAKKRQQEKEKAKLSVFHRIKEEETSARINSIKYLVGSKQSLNKATMQESELSSVIKMKRKDIFLVDLNEFAANWKFEKFDNSFWEKFAAHLIDQKMYVGSLDGIKTVFKEYMGKALTSTESTQRIKTCYNKLCRKFKGKALWMEMKKKFYNEKHSIHWCYLALLYFDYEVGDAIELLEPVSEEEADLNEILYAVSDYDNYEEIKKDYFRRYISYFRLLKKDKSFLKSFSNDYESLFSECCELIDTINSSRKKGDPRTLHVDDDEYYKIFIESTPIKRKLYEIQDIQRQVRQKVLEFFNVKYQIQAPGQSLTEFNKFMRKSQLNGKGDYLSESATTMSVNDLDADEDFEDADEDGSDGNNELSDGADEESLDDEELSQGEEEISSEEDEDDDYEEGNADDPYQQFTSRLRGLSKSKKGKSVLTVDDEDEDIDNSDSEDSDDGSVDLDISDENEEEEPDAKSKKNTKKKNGISSKKNTGKEDKKVRKRGADTNDNCNGLNDEFLVNGNLYKITYQGEQYDSVKVANFTGVKVKKRLRFQSLWFCHLYTVKSMESDEYLFAYKKLDGDSKPTLMKEANAVELFNNYLKLQLNNKTEKIIASLKDGIKQYIEFCPSKDTDVVSTNNGEITRRFFPDGMRDKLLEWYDAQQKQPVVVQTKLKTSNKSVKFSNPIISPSEDPFLNGDVESLTKENVLEAFKKIREIIYIGYKEESKDVSKDRKKFVIAGLKSLAEYAGKEVNIDAYKKLDELAKKKFKGMELVLILLPLFNKNIINLDDILGAK